MARIIIALALALAAGTAIAKPQAKPQVWTCEDVDGNRKFQDEPCAYYDKVVEAPLEKKAPKLDADPSSLLAFVPAGWIDALRKHWPMGVAALIIIIVLRQGYLLLSRSLAEARERRYEAAQAKEKRRIDRVPWKGT